MNYKYEACVYIGRFQPIHNAHLQTILIGLSKAKKVIISVGSYNRPQTIKNPWTTEQRIIQIKEAIKGLVEGDKLEGWSDYPTESILDRIEFISVRDYMYNNAKWAAELYCKAVAAGATQGKDTCLIGHYKDDSSFYLKMFQQWDLHTVSNFWGLNSTDFRTDIFEQNPIKMDGIPNNIVKMLHQYKNSDDYVKLWKEYNFIKKYIKMTNIGPYPPTFVTVDSLVVKSGHILLVNRKCNPGLGLWALPGGHLDQEETILKSAIRELKEETKIKIDKPVLERNVKEVKVFDHPKRSERGRTITHAHLIDLGEFGPLPEIKAASDAKLVRWFPIAELNTIENKMFEDHFDIITNLISRF